MDHNTETKKGWVLQKNLKLSVQLSACPVYFGIYYSFLFDIFGVKTYILMLFWSDGICQLTICKVITLNFDLRSHGSLGQIPIRLFYVDLVMSFSSLLLESMVTLKWIY